MRGLLVASVLLVGCSAYDTDLGPTPFLCGADEPRCPDGYACMPDPGSGREVCTQGAVSQDFDCADDSAMEPDDDLTMATMTSIDAMKTQQIGGRAICPAGDKDSFAITTTAANEAVELTVTYDADGGALRAALVNTSSVPIQVAMPVSGSTTMISAKAPNLPTGMYYVQVYGPAGGNLQVNNYSLTITVTP